MAAKQHQKQANTVTKIDENQSPLEGVDAEVLGSAACRGW